MKEKPRYRVFIISDKLYWRGDNTMNKRPTIKKFCDKKNETHYTYQEGQKNYFVRCN